MHLIKRDNQAFLSSCLYIPRCGADKTADQNMHTSELIERLYITGSSQLSFGCNNKAGEVNGRFHFTFQKILI